MPDNFFAMLDDGSIRRIPLAQSIENGIRNVFVSFGPALLAGREQTKFDGNYKIDDDEIMYVQFKLPSSFDEVSNNPIGIASLNLANDEIKSLFWYEDGVYYFQ